MSGLWTPGGDPTPPVSGGVPGAAAPVAAPEPDAEEIAAIRELHARITATPVTDMILNHGIGIWQLALVHLGVATPPDEQGRVPAPDLAQAGLAIDALAALVDGVGERLGEGEHLLRDALREAQSIFVQIAEALEGQAG